MNTADQNNQDLHPEFARFVEAEEARLAEQREFERDEAHRAVVAARKELDRIEESLRLADANEPYCRVGSVNGLDVRPVFSFFGAVERQAELAKYVAAARDDA